MPARDPFTPFVTGWDLIVATRRFQHRLEVAMDQSLEGYAVTFAQYRALEAIDATPRMHISGLARKLRVTRQGTHAVVRKLVGAGYLHVEDHGHVTTVELTALGRRRLDLFRTSCARIPRALEEVLGHDDRAEFQRLLRMADRALEPPRRPTWWLDRPDRVPAWQRELERADAEVVTPAG
jgi:DNA-binding MarR family transcriptional regulator